MKYAYPVRVERQDDGYHLVTAIDLPGIVVGGATLPEAIEAVSEACAMWLTDAEDEHEAIPKASDPRTVPLENDTQFTAVVLADTLEYRRKNDTRAVKKTLSLPYWMADRADQAGLSLSQVLQEALRDKLA